MRNESVRRNMPVGYPHAGSERGSASAQQNGGLPSHLFLLVSGGITHEDQWADVVRELGTSKGLVPSDGEELTLTAQQIAELANNFQKNDLSCLEGFALADFTSGLLRAIEGGDFDSTHHLCNVLSEAITVRPFRCGGWTLADICNRCTRLGEPAMRLFSTIAEFIDVKDKAATGMLGRLLVAGQYACMNAKSAVYLPKLRALTLALMPSADPLQVPVKVLRAIEFLCGSDSSEHEVDNALRLLLDCLPEKFLPVIQKSRGMQKSKGDHRATLLIFARIVSGLRDFPHLARTRALIGKIADRLDPPLGKYRLASKDWQSKDSVDAWVLEVALAMSRKGQLDLHYWSHSDAERLLSAYVTTRTESVEVVHGNSLKMRLAALGGAIKAGPPYWTSEPSLGGATFRLTPPAQGMVTEVSAGTNKRSLSTSQATDAEPDPSSDQHTGLVFKAAELDSYQLPQSLLLLIEESRANSIHKESHDEFLLDAEIVEESGHVAAGGESERHIDQFVSFAAHQPLGLPIDDPRETAIDERGSNESFAGTENITDLEQFAPNPDGTAQPADPFILPMSDDDLEDGAVPDK